MEALQILKAFIARLAGAPLASRAPPPAVRRAARHHAGFCPEELPSPPSSPCGRTAQQRDGDEGEAFARRYLECAGLVFVAANVRFRDGESDLVMRDLVKRDLVKRDLVMRDRVVRDRRLDRIGTGSLVFVEVRRRARDSHGGAAGSITREKRRRVVAAASHYLVGLGLRALPACRFDVVTIEGDPRQGFLVDWIRDAFREDE